MTNTGTIPLFSVGVVDSIAGDATYQSGDTNTDNQLEPTETWIFNDTYIIQSGDADPLINTATATGYAYSVPFTSTDDHSLDILTPAIEVVKEISLAAAGPWTETVTPDVGQNVYYRFVITNTGEVVLSNITLSDDLYPAATFDPALPATLAAGASFTTYYTAVAVEGTQPDTVTATGSPPAGSNVTDNDGASYTGTIPAAPGINVVKSGPETALVGDPIMYMFNVTNTGNVPLSNVTVVDDVAGAALTCLATPTPTSKLDVTETWTFTAAWTVAATPDPLVNTVTASGDYRRYDVYRR